MPIRSPRGRAAAYRAIWQWPLRSPARLAVTVVVVVAVVVGVSAGLGALGGGPRETGGETGPVAGGPTATRTSTGRSATPAPTALPPVADLTPMTLPPSAAPAAAVEVAARWSAAWLRPAEGVTGPQWMEGLRPFTTDEFLGQFATVDPANIPATRLTGEPQPVRVAANSVQVDVPTDALTLRVLVVLTEDRVWRVSGFDRV